ncbi:hypothetical protein [Saccharothrix isguenensis]
MNAQDAATLAPASGKAVIGIDGWSGGGPAPTPTEYQRYVADGRIGYFVSGSGMGGSGARGGTGEIGEWVAADHEAVTIGGRPSTGFPSATRTKRRPSPCTRPSTARRPLRPRWTGRSGMRGTGGAVTGSFLHVIRTRGRGHHSVG